MIKANDECSFDPTAKYFIFDKDCGYYGRGDFDSIEEVDKDTIGQFTGLYDKNGKEIYEGDIVEAGNLVGIVEYINGSFTLGADCPLCMLTVELKVVGDIYDNP